MTRASASCQRRTCSSSRKSCDYRQQHFTKLSVLFLPQVAKGGHLCDALSIQLLPSDVHCFCSGDYPHFRYDTIRQLLSSSWLSVILRCSVTLIFCQFSNFRSVAFVSAHAIGRLNKRASKPMQPCYEHLSSYVVLSLISSSNSSIYRQT